MLVFWLVIWYNKSIEKEPQSREWWSSAAHYRQAECGTAIVVVVYHMTTH